MNIELRQSKAEIDKLIEQNKSAQTKFEELKRIADQTLSAAEENETKLLDTEVAHI